MKSRIIPFLLLIILCFGCTANTDNNTVTDNSTQIDTEIETADIDEIMAPRNEAVSAKALLWFTEITYENLSDSYLCYCNVP